MKVRLVHAWVAGLVLSAGCGRLGFGLQPAIDAGTQQSSMDAATRDGATPADPMDASSMKGSSDGGGAGASSIEAGPSDAAQSDAAGSDASMSDAANPADATTDAAPDDQDSGTPPTEIVSDHCPEVPGAIFCDSFEDATAARWKYKIEINGTAVRSNALKRTGEMALHASTTSSALGTGARFASVDLNGVKSGEIWMRWFDYLPSSTVINKHFSAGVISEIVDPYAGLFVTVRPGSVGIGGMVPYLDGSNPFPRDRWVCVEIHAHVDPVSGFFELFVDGDKVVNSGLTNTVPADGFTSAEVGIHYVENGQGPVDIWVDDVILGFKRFGCN
jgi:hypothetical protein